MTTRGHIKTDNSSIYHPHHIYQWTPTVYRMSPFFPWSCRDFGLSHDTGKTSPAVRSSFAWAPIIKARFSKKLTALGAEHFLKSTWRFGLWAQDNAVLSSVKNLAPPVQQNLPCAKAWKTFETSVVLLKALVSWNDSNSKAPRDRRSDPSPGYSASAF